VAVVGVLAAAAGIGVAAAGAAPTGWGPADIVWSVALGAVATVAGSRARRWSGVVCAALAAVTANGWWFLVGLAALAVAVVAATGERRNRVLGAASVALASQALVRIDTWESLPRGTSAVVAGIALGVVIFSGWRNSSRRWRGLTARAGLATLAVAVVLSAVFGVGALLGYPSVREGVSLAEEGIDVAQVDERQAARQFRAATAELDTGVRWLANPLVNAARVVPFVGPQQRAAAVATLTARDLAATAANGAALVERDGLRPADGRVNLAEVRALAEPLGDTVGALESARVSLAGLGSPWLVPPVADRLGALEDSVADALGPTRLALQGAQGTPGMLGGAGDRRWLVLIPTPAETRFGGGFVGHWAVLEATNGEIELVDDGSAGALNAAAASRGGEPRLDDDYRSRYAAYNPERFFQNTLASPDFPTGAAIAASFYAAATGTQVQGVLSLDPFALGQLVELAGGVDVPTAGRSFSGADFGEYLVTAFYEVDDDTQDEIISEAIEGVVDGLTDGALPGPGALAEAMGTVAGEGRVQFWSPDPAEEAFFVALGIDGALPANTGQDFVFVALANAAPSKIDTYVARDVDYDVVVDPDTGDYTARLKIGLTNNATTDLPGVVIGNALDLPPATAVFTLSLFTPATTDSLTVDGTVEPVAAQSEGGWQVWSVPVEIPVGERTELVFNLSGVVEPGEYRLQWWPQPMVIAPELSLALDSTQGRAKVPDAVRRGPAPLRFITEMLPDGSVSGSGP
jgi:hypothetical protein